MTAVIGVLNKQAIAVAADSAVTISGYNGRKIFNTANKIFTLSKYDPVGVMIYNSASFMSTPWEVIIKLYREQLGTNKQNTLEDYTGDFISFLKSKDYFTSTDIQRSALKELFISILEFVNGKALEHTENNRPEDITNAIEKKIDELYSLIPEKGFYCDEFKDYTIEEFNAYSESTFEEAYQVIYESQGYSLGDSYKSKIRHIFFEHIRSTDFSNFFTGLIFVGFGHNEIYPSLIPLNISGVVDNRLRYFIDEKSTTKIGLQMESAIRPFAQTDVIDTVLSGVDPILDDIYINQFRDFFVKYNKAIIDSLTGTAKTTVSKGIQNIDIENLTHKYAEQMGMVRRSNYVEPLMSAVSSLSKEDLAEMAESLIYLTYLKRRITFAEESVGGPVDVALISKCDGFIWMKRKHYFKPELNHHFLLTI